MVFCFFTLGVTSERSHFVAEFQAKNDKKGQTRIHATLPSFYIPGGWVGPQAAQQPRSSQRLQRKAQEKIGIFVYKPPNFVGQLHSCKVINP